MPNQHKIALLTGAGSVINAWDPVLEFLTEYLDYPVTPDQVNSFLARSIYLNRFYASEINEHNKQMLVGVEKQIVKIKKGICDSLTKSMKKGKLKPRKQLKEILYKFIFERNSQAVHITTNWDTVVEDHLNEIAFSSDPKNNNKIPAIYLHGSIKDHKSLYLPSEIVNEVYRSKTDTIQLGMVHGLAWSSIEIANELIIYGLSLDPLDAELNQTVAAGISSPNMKKIIVINPSYELICKRVKILIDPRYPLKLVGIDPSDLNQEYVF